MDDWTQHITDEQLALEIQAAENYLAAYGPRIAARAERASNKGRPLQSDLLAQAEARLSRLQAELKRRTQ